MPPAAPTPVAAPAPAPAPRPRRGVVRRCAWCCVLATLMAILLGGGSLAAYGAAYGLGPRGVWASINFFFMKLARDLSRVKARRRRFGQENALMPVLMPVLMGREEVQPAQTRTAPRAPFTGVLRAAPRSHCRWLTPTKWASL